MLLNDRSHIPWAIGSLATTVLAVVLFAYASHDQTDWPGGGSALGLTYGFAAAAIFVFESLLWPRKRWCRTWRRLGPLPLGTATLWMRAHIWLGLLCVPLAILHSGLRLGGGLTTLLAADFALVIGSGIVGLVLQNRLPKYLTSEVAEETIHSQIDEVMRSHALETARLIDDVCGLPPKRDLTAVERVGFDRESDEAPVYRTVGVHRSGRTHGPVLTTRPPAERVAGAEPLRTFFCETAADYLLRGQESSSPLRSPAMTEARFRELRQKLPPAARPALETLEEQCARRRQFDRQARLHFWLHSWLWLHLPGTVLLLSLTLAHALSTLRY